MSKFLQDLARQDNTSSVFTTRNLISTIVAGSKLNSTFMVKFASKIIYPRIKVNSDSHSTGLTVRIHHHIMITAQRNVFSKDMGSGSLQLTLRDAWPVLLIQRKRLLTFKATERDAFEFATMSLQDTDPLYYLSTSYIHTYRDLCDNRS